MESNPDEARRAGECAEDHTYDGGSDTNGSPTILSAVVAVYEPTWMPSRLSRQITRALINALAAEYAAPDAYASVLALSYHVNTNQPSAAVHARCLCDHVATVHIQAGAISKAARAFNTLVLSIERSHRALSDCKCTYGPLYDSIQADDGDISIDQRLQLSPQPYSSREPKHSVNQPRTCAWPRMIKMYSTGSSPGSS